ncbi:NADPH oxidase 4-like, partial [Nematolebias whitei]|uniref:NADPH oxidase 4-like n=1 Tax=Nematolebias whitei TaxID=451745 RepID=UPI00189BBE90
VLFLRVSNYEIFWYTHNLFIVFYVILMVHMVGGALKYQTNIETHPPGCLRANQSSPKQQDEGDESRCREEAHFEPHYPQTWLWVSGPLCLYCVERLYRYIWSSDPVSIVTVIRHPCNVIELRMLKKNFKAQPGQYIVLNCPGVSSFENHPFTLTMTLSEERHRLLSSRLQVGRPRWKLLLDEIGKSNKHNRVGVFCCGPKGISRTLRRLCNSSRSCGTTFEFNKESFS